MTGEKRLQKTILPVLASCLLLSQLCPMGVEAKTAKLKLPQRDFLPPVASINGALPSLSAPKTGEEPLEAVTLSAISSPAVKIRKPVLKLDSDLGIRTSTDEYQELLRIQKTLDEEDLRMLWEATVEKNPVIRFSLEKLSTPTDLQPKKSSIFLNKTLNVLISGATMAATMVPGGSYYRNVGAMAGGDALRNLVNGNTKPQVGTLTATEQIQLAGLVDELQGKLIQTYHDYKNGLQALTSAHQVTLRNNELYRKSLDSGNDLAILAAGSAYYKALMNETELRQKAKINRLRLERLAGDTALGNLKLSLSFNADITGQEGHENRHENGVETIPEKSPTSKEPDKKVSAHPDDIPMPLTAKPEGPAKTLSVPSSYQIPLPHDDIEADTAQDHANQKLQSKQDNQ